MNDEEKLRWKKCDTCEFLQHKSHLRCLNCKANKFTLIEASGECKLITFTILNSPPAEFRDRPSYALGVVEFENGIKAIGQISPQENLKTGMKLMREDGRVIGSIKGMQSENKPIEEAIQGEEVAISIEGVTVGRQIKGEDILYTDIPENDAKKLKDMDVLNTDEKDLLNKIIEIKRKENKFWGM